MPLLPRRARFQIHLSTAIILMFAAGGLLWANVQSYDHDPIDNLTDAPNVAYFNYIPATRYPKLPTKGWPRPFAQKWKVQYQPELNNTYGYEYEWNWKRLAVDAAIALTILFTVGILCEWQIRHSAARKRA